VGRNRQGSSNKRRRDMDSGRYEKQHSDMGYRWLIGQKEGKRTQWSWMDYLLHQDRPTINGYLLGEVQQSGFRTLHLFAQAVAEFYKVEQWSSMISCDNKRVLKLSSHHRRRIRPSAKCADIQRNLRTIKQSFTGNFKYFHVYGHMDKYLK
jgi:hypothetical protein